ncbi:MAG: DUF1987 domain-containing protein [Bacteroidales bacterium]|nr:DUF1987 domain-containing protein [Bacteroidales bacterium]
MFEKSFVNGHNIEITWQYEEDDESIHELGMDLNSFCKVPIRLEQVM